MLKKSDDPSAVLGHSPSTANYRRYKEDENVPESGSFLLFLFSVKCSLLGENAIKSCLVPPKRKKAGVMALARALSFGDLQEVTHKQNLDSN